MPRDSSVYLEDILQAAARIHKYVGSRSLEEFRQDTMAVDAVVRNLEVIGEAVKRLPEAMRRDCPAIEWKKIAGLRDILIHAYFWIDVEIIWDVIQKCDIPRRAVR